MGAGRWIRHLRGYAAARLAGDAARALRERREIALLALDGDARELAFERDGLRWTTAAVRHTITRNLYVHGRHPRDEIPAFAAWLRARGRLGDAHPWCCDVGANVGAPTLFLARDLGRRVLAVEPVPATFELLVRNVTANGMQARVRCVNAAVSDAPGTVRMLTHEKDGWSEIATADGRQGFGAAAAARDAVDVPAMRLDDAVAQAGAAPGHVAFVWSDTQGFETHVLRSAPALWAAGVPAFVEVWPEGLALQGGVDGFLAACREHFAGFIPRDDLVARREAADVRPIAALEPFVRGLAKQTDAVLVPRAAG